MLPKTPGVDGAPRAVAEEGKKLEGPKLEDPGLPNDWFPELKLAPKLPPGLAEPILLGAIPRLRVGGPDPGKP